MLSLLSVWVIRSRGIRKKDVILDDSTALRSYGEGRPHLASKSVQDQPSQEIDLAHVEQKADQSEQDR
jgi:hypothetical protein